MIWTDQDLEIEDKYDCHNNLVEVTYILLSLREVYINVPFLRKKEICSEVMNPFKYHPSFGHLWVAILYLF